MKKAIILLGLSLVLFSCKQDKKDIIARKWQAVRLESPAMDSMLANQMAFLDTFGKNTTPAQNMEIYGVSNVDSMRQSLLTQMNDFKAMQEHAVKNTWFDFRKDGIALMNFSGQLDSANWYFDDEGALMLDEMKLKGAGNKIKMEIISLADTAMSLRFTEQNTTSMVTFHPSEK